MTMTVPTKVKIVSTKSSMLLVRILSSDKQVEMNPNELVRRVEEGAYELVDFIAAQPNMGMSEN